jgi:hypothetical protein
MSCGGEFSRTFWFTTIRLEALRLEILGSVRRVQLKMPTNYPDDCLIPPEAAPFMGILLAAHLHSGDISGFLREEPAAVLQDVAAQIRERECLINPLLGAFDIPVLDGPSWWMSEVVPAIENELRRRSRPKKIYSGGPIARLMQLDIVTVAEKFTILQPAGAGKLKGLCPLHEEKTASFYVYQEGQRWRCYGACAEGGDVINLVARLSERRSTSG